MGRTFRRPGYGDGNPAFLGWLLEERPVTLSEMRTKPELEGMPLLQKGNRLSVQKVGSAEWNAVLRIAKQSPG